MATLQSILTIVRAQEQHWVGDAFLVSTVFSPNLLDPQVLSPFLLMDHAAPKDFPPAKKARGVGEHPHRGFETVTFAYAGEVAHRDSHGGGGIIGPGDVQWMTAGSGVVHEEFHSERFTAEGGTFEMVQLWVNLPARLKMTSPRYQGLEGQSFPRILFSDGVEGRLIAGEVHGLQGPALTHTPITLFDIDFETASSAQFELAAGTTTLLFVLRGSVQAQRDQTAQQGDLLVLDRTSKGAVKLEGESGSRVLVLNGEPLHEPVFTYGPFVMNTRAEIVEAIHDYQRGLMGTLAPTS
jgi:redox-sensitive bicupin YhaK (pirin superfamily)